MMAIISISRISETFTAQDAGRRFSSLIRSSELLKRGVGPQMGGIGMEATCGPGQRES